MPYFANTSTVRYCLRRNDDDDQGQVLEVRLTYFKRLISRSPSAGLPYEIMAEERSPLMADFSRPEFPLPLRQLEDPLFCHAYVILLLSPFNLGAVNCNAIARKITSFVVQLAADNYDANFHLVADIDYIQIFWIEEERRRSSDFVQGVLVEERVVPDESPPLAPPEEIEYCCVCCDKLKAKGKEVAKIPCGHMYHKSCILTWFQTSDSCPLCRSKLSNM